MDELTATKRKCSWWRRQLIRQKSASVPLYYVILVVVICLGMTVVIISASCQHVEFFEAAGISKFDCSREILLSSLTTISFVVILALETSIHSGVSEQWRFHVNILELLWSLLMLLSWLISSGINTMDWHHLVFLSDEAQQQYINDVQISVMRDSYIVLIATSYANSVTWATLVYIHLRRSTQVRGSFKMYWKWLLVMIMCLMFAVNAYLMVHVAMQRNICSTYAPHHTSSSVTATSDGNYHISKMKSFPAQILSSLRIQMQNCSWPSTEQNLKRKAFCNKYFWYMDICRCHNPIDFIATSPKLSPNNVANVPVAIIASNRTRCLSRALHSVLLADGANMSMVNVFLDGPFQEQIDVCKLFGVNVTIHHLHSSRDTKNSFRITEHYRISLTEMFDYYSTANSIIILEDDLQVSPDFFSYFSQTVHLLDKDNSLYCISAWNDFGYQHASHDPSLLYRVDTMPGLGWLLKRSLYKDELESKWPNESEPLTWDGWMREPEQRKGRECIIPDVSRTFHFAPGTHVHLRQQKKYFETRSFNRHRQVKLKNLSWLTKDVYEQTIHHLIRSAKLVNHTETVCNKQLIPDTKGERYVMYLEHSDAVLVALMKCFHLWDIDIRGDHKNMWRFWHKENHIIILRCPLSPYCIHKPSHISPLKLSVPKSKLALTTPIYHNSTQYINRKQKQKKRRHILVGFYVATFIIIMAVCILRFLAEKFNHRGDRTTTSSNKALQKLKYDVRTKLPLESYQNRMVSNSSDINFI